MNKAYPVSIEDPAADCPVSAGTLNRFYRANPIDRSELLNTIPETTRARLAVWLYGRSHTHELGVQVAATCEGSALRHAAGLLGNALHELSRQPYTAPSHGAGRPSIGRRISLAGGRQATPHFAA